MGNTLNQARRKASTWRNRRRKPTDQISYASACPLCGKKFSKSSTWSQFNNHVDSCLLNQQQVPQQEQKHSNPQELAIDLKLNYVYNELKRLAVHWSEGAIKIIVNRDDILSYSFTQILGMSQQDLRMELQVSFDGEIAQDAGGLSKEWCNLVMQEIFNESNGIFVRANTETVQYVIPYTNNSDNLYYYEATGRLMGKAFFDKIPVYCPLSKAIFKYLTGRELGFKDLGYVDEDIYRSLVYIKENSIDGQLFETFTVNKEYGGSVYNIPLIEGGEQIELSDENKESYLFLRAEYEVQASVQQQLQSLVDGFYTVVPFDIVKLMQPEELELCMCGLQYIDVENWKQYTLYKGEYNARHKVILKFWNILFNLGQSELSKFLEFVTGSPRLPVQGFQSLKTARGEDAKFTIQSIQYQQSGQLPKAHTCFNRLDLPVYPTQKEMQKALLYVIENHSHGFGLE